MFTQGQIHLECGSPRVYNIYSLVRRCFKGADRGINRVSSMAGWYIDIPPVARVIKDTDRAVYIYLPDMWLLHNGRSHRATNQLNHTTTCGMVYTTVQ